LRYDWVVRPLSRRQFRRTTLTCVPTKTSEKIVPPPGNLVHARLLRYSHKIDYQSGNQKTTAGPA
jgi:hypothetical protein